jgi:hypothetical protein
MNMLGKLVHSRSAWSRGALAASALVMVLLAQVIPPGRPTGRSSCRRSRCSNGTMQNRCIRSIC